MTPEQILHKWDTHVSEPCDKYPFTDDDKIAFARAIIAQARAELIAEMVPVAWRCEWDGGWRQYHDERDPMPAAWDEPPETITTLAVIPSTKEGHEDQ